MSDVFVPIAQAAPNAASNGFTPLDFKALAATSVKSGASANSAPAPAAPGLTQVLCANPKVTLQRQGEVVSAIRIQCGCGRLIELNCVY
jgi:hypothetical protein